VDVGLRSLEHRGNLNMMRMHGQYSPVMVGSYIVTLYPTASENDEIKSVPELMLSRLGPVLGLDSLNQLKFVNREVLDGDLDEIRRERMEDYQSCGRLWRRRDYAESNAATHIITIEGGDGRLVHRTGTYIEARAVLAHWYEVLATQTGAFKALLRLLYQDGESLTICGSNAITCCEWGEMDERLQAWYVSEDVDYGAELILYTLLYYWNNRERLPWYADYERTSKL
jgi:hypothetical protein